MEVAHRVVELAALYNIYTSLYDNHVCRQIESVIPTESLLIPSCLLLVFTCQLGYQLLQDSR